MSKNLILLERHKHTDYVVNYDGKRYQWSGAKNGIVGRKEIPMDVYDWLSMFTNCFKNGELIVKAKEEDKEEILNTMNELESYEVNALTREQIIDLLNGNLNKMKKELGAVTSKTTISFIIDIAREIKVENMNKLKFLKELEGSDRTIEEIFNL